MVATMGTESGGMVDCHCHLSAPDFDGVCGGEAGPGRGEDPVLSLHVIFAFLPKDDAPDPPGLLIMASRDLLLTPNLTRHTDFYSRS